MYPLTGSSEAPNRNGRQVSRGVAIVVCVPLLEVEVKAADHDCRNAACIESTSAEPDSETHLF